MMPRHLAPSPTRSWAAHMVHRAWSRFRALAWFRFLAPPQAAPDVPDRALLVREVRTPCGGRVTWICEPSETAPLILENPRGGESEPLRIQCLRPSVPEGPSGECLEALAPLAVAGAALVGVLHDTARPGTFGVLISTPEEFPWRKRNPDSRAGQPGRAHPKRTGVTGR